MLGRFRSYLRHRIVITLTSLGVVLFVLMGSFRAFVIAGASDAPTLLINDKVVVNRIAYDLFLPFTEISLLSWSDPQRGDIILCGVPGIVERITWLKRVVGVPGDVVEMRDHKLIINGEKLDYVVHDLKEFADVPLVNRLGSVVATETGAGTDHLVTYTPGPAMASFAPVTVTEGHYFVLGDSRDNSKDSRMVGLIPRASILGKFVGTLVRAAPDC
jgi:signal peptidase I